MKKSTKTNIIAVCTLSVISLLSINVSALDYQKTINVGFNVQDTLTVSLSSPNLIIDNLMPGTASDSNIITVNVLSNNPYGYTLNSTVGSTTYANRNLTHSSSASATPFSSINYGTTVADLSSFSPNQWGYSFSTDNGTTWINSNKTDGTTNDTGYSGLPFYTDTENITTLKESDTTSAAAGDNIQFKIAAKADATQLSGEYNNIINFVLTGAPAPPSKVYMQDLDSTSIAALLPNVGDTATVYDNRDEEEYTIAKLADGKYWMTENLNLAGGTALDSTNTDMNAGANMSTSNGFQAGNKLPASSTAGFSSNTMAYVYNSGNNTTTCNSNTPCNSYYSWTAATLGSGLNITTDNTDADSSICPKGWRLPKSRTTSATNWQTVSDFYALAHQYGLDSTTSTSESDNGFYTQAGPGTTPNFLLAGRYYNGQFYRGGSYGDYWSATSSSSTLARGLSFLSSIVYSAGISYRYHGFSVRCVFGE